MLDFIGRKENCTGCSACYAACPVHCITMKKDEEGFFYPEADIEKCIKCGKCQKVCPIASSMTEDRSVTSQTVITARSKSHEVWKTSASGGAFTEICKAWGDETCQIYGAVMRDGYVRHEIGEFKDIVKFRKSKYVQSNQEDTFSNVKDSLERGYKVVYSGTPCQVAGLRSFLRKDYPNLLLIDFICHGVGSPAVLRKCMNYVGEQRGFNCTNYLFRQKEYINGQLSIYVSFYSKTDKKDAAILDKTEDPYLSFFFNQLCLRPCCQENCRFRHPYRLSDITLADYKSSVKRKAIPIRDYKNYSSIILNTAKGKELHEQLVSNMVSKPSSVGEIAKINPLFFKTTLGNNNRNAFFQDFVFGIGVEDLLGKYCKKEVENVKKLNPRQALGRAYEFFCRLVGVILDRCNIY